HLLDGEQFLALLSAQSAASVSALRERATAPLSRPDYLLAQHLFWRRGPLLSERDRRDLSAWIARRPRGPREEAAPETPAVAVPGRGAPRAGGAGLAAAPSDPDAQLRTDFIALMRYTGSEEDGRALVAIATKMLESPTARRYAREFVRRGETVTFRLEDMAGSVVQEENGRRSFTGTRGYTYTTREPMEVALNRHFLTTDPSHEHAAGTMAHELLGHGLRGAQAKEKNVSEAWGRYINDETNARLVGWVVRGELGGRLDDGYMWSYLRDPNEYYRSIETGSEYYAGTLQAADMGDPVPVYRRRIAVIQEKKRSYEAWRTALQADQAAIAHFTGAQHNVPARRFSVVSQETENRLQTIPTWIAEWDQMETSLNALVTRFSSRDGRREAARLAVQAGDPFFNDVETEMAGLQRTLAGLARGRTEDGENRGAPDPPDQISRAELRRMRDDDRRRNPAHWPAA
ncbi:MAG TPA: hypothetical protein VNI01_09540, partial [Elusimicrobiota bacterium]|nr:hypothetical protein [Elusimicrobiota bacterium]